jgi:hypothetical protein
MALLVVAADVSLARSGGVHVLPKLAEVDVKDRGPFAVRLVLPDGSAREARAVIDIPHVRGSAPPIGMLRILDATVDDVPVGTRIER